MHRCTHRTLSYCACGAHLRPPGRRLCSFAPEVAITPDPESSGPGQSSVV